MTERGRQLTDGAHHAGIDVTRVQGPDDVEDGQIDHLDRNKVITLGAKALAPNSDKQFDGTAYSPTLVRLLSRQGFAARIELRAANSDVVATRGACR